MTGVSPTTLTYDLLQEYPYSVITSYVVKESVYKQEWDVYYVYILSIYFQLYVLCNLFFFQKSYRVGINLKNLVF